MYYCLFLQLSLCCHGFCCHDCGCHMLQQSNYAFFFPTLSIMRELIYFDHIDRSLHFNFHFETKILQDMLHEMSILRAKLDFPPLFSLKVLELSANLSVCKF